MAESASTGNSGNGNGGTGTTSTSTSTSTSNGGAASAGSQSSSNGSFSTGNGNGSTGPGLSFGAGITSNSNGNFSGGLPGFAPGYTGLASDNYGQGWGSGQHTVHQGADGKHTITPDANGKHTVHVDRYTKGNDYSSNNTNYMTVDEVYGNLNQSIVENQGDYEASSNEKSNVETSTFGKQDEISVTPTSVTEDKGLVNNDAIQSVEGLDFQQKDKANQEVMEAKKSRDEAEAEDNSNGMRNQLKAVAEKDAEETETDAFQVGEKDTFEEQNKAKLDELNSAKQQAEDLSNKEKEAITVRDKAEADEKAAIAAADKIEADAKQAKQELGKLQDYLDSITPEEDESPLGKLTKAAKSAWDIMTNKDIQKTQAALAKLAKDYGIDVGDTSKFITGASLAKGIETVENTMQARVQEAQVAKQEAITNAESARNQLTEISTERQAAQDKYTKTEKAYNTWKANYWAGAEKTKAEEEAAEETVTTEAPSYKTKIEAARNEINNAKDLTDEQKAETNAVLGNVEAAADKMNDAANALAANPNDASAIETYFNATKQYNKALKDAKGNKTLKNTDYNKTFVESVAAANDFDVTKADGSVVSYAEFAAEMATKSPELAKGLYEAKAAKLAEDGHKVLAAIETAKSKMVMTWLGSKFTFADNQVRSQFNQMAKTDMRATYAAYNNVLSDPNATPEQKAEAFDAIQQANNLMTASAALQASTGFFSGIGDGTSDGVYGKTDPTTLNGYQKALNTASNFAKIALGLGVTPGANEAYQNMYYLAGAKVNESGLFSKDFDGDGFALCQEYGNNAAVGMIAGAGELATGVALMFNPATSKMGINLAIDSVQTFLDGLYGVQKEVNKSIKYSSEVLSYFGEAKSIAAETGNKEAISTISNAIKQIEDFQLKSDEVSNLDNWLEGSGSNTADNGKFNQALSYDEWLKLIEADPVMQEYAKSLNR